jgi:hypothetical protein
VSQGASGNPASSNRGWKQGVAMQVRPVPTHAVAAHKPEPNKSDNDRTCAAGTSSCHLAEQ